MDSPLPISFPSHEIDPREKDADWILQFAQAAYADCEKNMPLFNGRQHYDTIRRYAMGKQDQSKYEKMLLGDENNGKSWYQMGWEIRAIIPKYREIAVSKLMQRQFNIEAEAVDVLAKDDADEYFNKMRSKLMMRQALQEQNPAMLNNPAVQLNPGEPQDMEELEMQMDFGYKHNMAMEAEMAIDLVMRTNNIERERKKVCENFFDHGIGGYKEWIDTNGQVCFRAVAPDNRIMSYCVQPDFSDLSYAGEVIEVTIADIAPYFSPEDRQEIAKCVAGKYDNPLMNGDVRFFKGLDKFKVQVLDLEFFSYNTTVYKNKIDKTGNERFLKTDFSDYGKVRNMTTSQGESEPKYSDLTRKVIYKTKWIIGTNFQYEYGLATNQKRVMSNPFDTDLSYHFFAWNFDKMRFTGITERLIPLADDYQVTCMRIQNFKNKWIPYIIDIDLDALEAVAIGKGGVTMKPMELIDFMFQNNIMISRRSNIAGNNINYKSVDVVPTQMAQELAVLVQDLDRTDAIMQRTCGLNEVTDGSSPNPKNLNSTNEAAIQGTNNALYMLSDGEQKLLERLATAIIQRLQIAVKLGKVEGYVRALGSDSIKFFQVSQDINLHEFGIFIRDSITDDQRLQILQNLNLKDANGLIDPDVLVMAYSIHNLKQLRQYVAYKVKKAKQQQQQDAMQMQQQNGQIQVQSAQAAEQSKQQTLQIAHQLEMERMNAEMQWQFIIQKMKVDGAGKDAEVSAQAKVLAQTIQANAKMQTSTQG